MTSQSYCRFAHWSALNYGDISLPGVVSHHQLALDGREGSHLGTGWHEAESGFRWSAGAAVAFLHRMRGQDTLEVQLSAGPRVLGAVHARIEAAGKALEIRVTPIDLAGWQRVQLRLPPATAEQSILRVTITAKQLRRPGDYSIDDPRAVGVAVRSIGLSGRAQCSDLALCSICNPVHWQHPAWLACLKSLEYRSQHGAIAPELRHRKLWEWIHGVAGMVRLGRLQPSTHALGIAVGHEPVIYWLANRVSRVVATDLYRGTFADNEATPDVLRDPDKYAPYAYPRERVRFLPMSGTDICFGDETFDLVFSFCSIEHFGSRANSARALREMARVLRPGGIAVVSTEVLLNDQPPQEEIFAPWEIYETLVAPSGLLMIGDIAPADLSPYFAAPINLLDRNDLSSGRPHFVLRIEQALFTSVMLFLQKA